MCYASRIKKQPSTEGRKEKKKMRNEKRIGLLKNKKMGDYEKTKGFASYRTIIDRFVGDIVLCNNIMSIDDSFCDNLYNGYDEESEEYKEIYQCYLCNINDYNKKLLLDMGIMLSYSDMLDCDILCVNHYGTSWDYVLTDVKLFDNYEDLEKYEKGRTE